MTKLACLLWAGFAAVDAVRRDRFVYLSYIDFPSSLERAGGLAHFLNNISFLNRSKRIWTRTDRGRTDEPSIETVFTIEKAIPAAVSSADAATPRESPIRRPRRRPRRAPEDALEAQEEAADCGAAADRRKSPRGPRVVELSAGGIGAVGRFEVSTDDAYVQADSTTIAPRSRATSPRCSCETMSG